MFSFSAFRPPPKVFSGRENSSREKQTRTEDETHPYDRICCQLTLEHGVDIYSFLETSVGS